MYEKILELCHIVFLHLILKNCTVILSMKFPRNSACHYMLEKYLHFFYRVKIYVYVKCINVHKVYDAYKFFVEIQF